MPVLALPDDVAGANAWDIDRFRHDNPQLLDVGAPGGEDSPLVFYALPTVRTMFVTSWREALTAGGSQTFADWLDEVTGPARPEPTVRDRWRYDLAVATWVREVGASRVTVCLEPDLRRTLAVLERLLDVPDGTLVAPSPSKKSTASYAAEPTLEAALDRELTALYPDGSLEAELEHAAWPSLHPVGGRPGSKDLPAELADRRRLRGRASRTGRARRPPGPGAIGGGLQGRAEIQARAPAPAATGEPYGGATTPWRGQRP